ncbi:MAG TPA: nuclear transport factor 2 family protein [Acidobacteriaceae bacterium]|nr:nuclear transport factor 2 family protein [Acidobacteriaceae bacterium]
MRALLLGLTLSLVSLPLYAGPHRVSHTMRDQIEALETQWKNAILSNDIEAMDRLLSDDYLGITASGQVVTKPQQLDRMRSHNLALSSLNVSDVKIKLISQHAAIVTSLVQVDGTNDGRPIHGSFRYTRVYQRLSGTTTWKITSFEATRVPSRLAQADSHTPQEH